MSAIVNRRIQWVSAVDPRCAPKLCELNRRLTSYYSASSSYYQNIDFTADSWANDPIYSHVVEAANQSQAILEIGCGRANILRFHPDLADRYTGVDFNEQLLDQNQSTFPAARFVSLNDSSQLPFQDREFDFVFSMFVIEHCVYPHRVLKECARVLRENGRLMLLCPEFLNRHRMSSQRTGFGAGTGREKLRKGKVMDALVTAFDTRLRMPLYCIWYRYLAQRKPRFWINLQPTCFTDPFQPDVDAVYVTYADEMRQWLSGDVNFSDLPPALAEDAQNRTCILLDGRRRS